MQQSLSRLCDICFFLLNTNRSYQCARHWNCYFHCKNLQHCGTTELGSRGLRHLLFASQPLTHHDSVTIKQLFFSEKSQLFNTMAAQQMTLWISPWSVSTQWREQIACRYGFSGHKNQGRYWILKNYRLKTGHHLILKAKLGLWSAINLGVLTKLKANKMVSVNSND